MIVTPSTPDRQAEERRTGRRRHVIERVVSSPLDFVRRDLSREHARSEEPGRHHRQRIARLELVASELPLHELIVRHVGIERLDHEVAIPIRERPIVVLFESVTLGEASDVQPVTPPTLAVLRRIEQLVEHFFKRLRIGIVDERFNVRRLRRQPDEIKVRSANQRAAIHRGIRRQALLGQLRDNEIVDRIANPFCGVGTDSRRRDDLQRLKRPELASLRRHLAASPRLRIFDDFFQRVVIRSTQINPLRNRRDVQVGQLRPVGRHVRFFFLFDELHQQTRLRLADFDHRSGLAPFDQSFARREVELPFRLLTAVTFHAAADEDLLDLFLEEIKSRRSLLGMSRIDLFLRRIGRRDQRDGRANQNRGGEQREARHQTTLRKSHGQSHQMQPI